MIARSLDDFLKVEPQIYEYCGFGYSTFIALEGFLPSGSIKFITAMGLVRSLEKQYSQEELRKLTIIESSSGNLAIALSMVCNVRGYRFAAIIDNNTTNYTVNVLRACGAEMIKITERDENGGYLLNRIRKIKELLLTGNYIWTNQYANPANPEIHHDITGASLYKQIPHPNYLFIGAGTTGTLCGVGRYFKEHSPQTKIVAVEPVGSVTFGGKAANRTIPGIGTSRRPELADNAIYDDIAYVKEEDTIGMCKRMISETGLMLGGSSGSVLSGIEKYFQTHEKPGKVLCISPDNLPPYLELMLPRWEGK